MNAKKSLSPWGLKWNPFSPEVPLQGLLATGEGSRANPYLVCHATDEYDLLEALDLQPAGQPRRIPP